MPVDPKTYRDWHWGSESPLEIRPDIACEGWVPFVIGGNIVELDRDAVRQLIADLREWLHEPPLSDAERDLYLDRLRCRTNTITTMKRDATEIQAITKHALSDSTQEGFM